ncbi:MAG: hypothetical protein ACREBH_00290 [Candidatus Micrarchaeaceae archaeon]
MIIDAEQNTLNDMARVDLSMVSKDPSALKKLAQSAIAHGLDKDPTEILFKIAGNPHSGMETTAFAINNMMAMKGSIIKELARKESDA